MQKEFSMTGTVLVENHRDKWYGHFLICQCYGSICLLQTNTHVPNPASRLSGKHIKSFEKVLEDNLLSLSNWLIKIKLSPT